MPRPPRPSRACGSPRARSSGPSLSRSAPRRSTRTLARLQLGRLEEARPALERSLALDAAHEGALYNLGGLHLSQGRPAAALRSFRALAALRPDDANVAGLVRRAEREARP
jgi:Flp pilus assembly protein TadD